MNEFKWIIADLDGTLIDHKNHNEIYSDVVDELHRAIKGKKFSIATGRHYKDVIDINNRFGISMPKDSYIIGLNGCQIYSVDKQELLVNRVLDDPLVHSEIPKIMAFLDKELPHSTLMFAYGENENIYFVKNDSARFKEMIKTTITHEDNSTLFKYSIVHAVKDLKIISKLCVEFDKPIKDPLKLMEKLRKVSDKFDYANTNPHFIEIIMKDINKATAIQYLNNNFYRFAPEEMLAFGDSGNDIEMLEYVGTSVTRTDARPEITKICTKAYEGGASYFVKNALIDLVK
ncbi:MAG: Cof-type HAD-IIB family hydrolase [Metamycoplasmataceae bacterium]